jgi:hypothetical protein
MAPETETETETEGKWREDEAEVLSFTLIERSRKRVYAEPIEMETASISMECISIS